MKPETKQQKRSRRHKRVRAKVFGTTERPRLHVFRSNQHIYAQLLDDEKGRVLVFASDITVKGRDKKGVGLSKKLGLTIAEKAKEKKIQSVVFDRGGYEYHGNIKAIAEGAREGGLEF